MTDQCETLRAIAEDGVMNTEEMIARCEKLFTDKTGKSVVFSTVHKAKGLEADTVWLIGPTFRPKHGSEERNILYVAITRAKHVLNICGEIVW